MYSSGFGNDWVPVIKPDLKIEDELENPFCWEIVINLVGNVQTGELNSKIYITIRVIAAAMLVLPLRSAAFRLPSSQPRRLRLPPRLHRRLPSPRLPAPARHGWRPAGDCQG